MKIIDAKEFNEIRSNGNLVVDFYADWCGPCKMLGPILEAVSEDYPDVNFVKVNVDDNEELAAEFGIMSIPSVFMLKDGQIVNEFKGVQQEKTLKEIFDKTFR